MSNSQVRIRIDDLPESDILTAEQAEQLMGAGRKIRLEIEQLERRELLTTYVTPPVNDEVMLGPIDFEYSSQGGSLGMPLSEEIDVPGARAKYYQNGAIYFTGSDTHTLYDRIFAKYQELGETAGVLGLPSSDEHVTPGGWGAVNHFDSGDIYFSPETGAHAISARIAAKYAEIGGSEVFGLPVSDEQDVPGGRMTRFQGGDIYWSEQFGAWELRDAIAAKYRDLGGASGALGLPMNATQLGRGQVVQFQNGYIYSTEYGQAYMYCSWDILSKYAFELDPGLNLGWPAGDEQETSGGRLAPFDNGVIYSSPRSGAIALSSGIAARYVELGGAGGALGFPTSDAYAYGNGRLAHFENGIIFETAGGTRVLTGMLAAKYRETASLADPSGRSVQDILGFPTTEERDIPGGRAVYFQNGVIYWSPETGAHVVYGTIRGSTEFGLPISDLVEVPGGQMVRFQGGDIYYSPTHLVSSVWGPIADKYNSLGGAHGVLGLPTSNQEQFLGGFVQHFADGTIYWSEQTGAHVMYRIRHDKLSNTVISDGRLIGEVVGLPTSDEEAIPGGSVVHLERGDIYWNPSSWAHLVFGAIAVKYSSLGGSGGMLGLPTSDPYTVPGGTLQQFMAGQLFLSEQTGECTLISAIDLKYRETAQMKDVAGKSVQGLLGQPTSAEQEIPGGRVRYYQGGAIYWSATFGARVVYGVIGTKYSLTANQKDPSGRTVQSILGMPTADERDVGSAGSGARVSYFEGGAIYWSAKTGARVVRGAIADKYWSLWETSSFLGLPVSDEMTVRSGRVVNFQGGAIYWSEATGARVISSAIRSKYEETTPLAQFNNRTLRDVLGLPISDERDVEGGRMVHFQYGEIFWSPSNGVSVTYDPIWQKYLNVQNVFDASGKSVREILGNFAIDAEVVPGGKVRQFAGGAIYWSQVADVSIVNGAVVAMSDVSKQSYVMYGPILSKYRSLGGPNSFLAMPASAEMTLADGTRMMDFKGGVIIWPAGGAARAISLAVYNRYIAAAEYYHLGQPLSDEVDIPGGRVARFEKGDIYWTQATGAVLIRNDIRIKYNAMKGPSGPLGLPISDELSEVGGRVVHFQGGDIYWSPNTGARALTGAIWVKHKELTTQLHPSGHSRAVMLGLPTSDEMAAPAAGKVVHFQGGSIYWSEVTGAHSVDSVSRDKYQTLAKVKDVNGQVVQNLLGLPISDSAYMSLGEKMYGVTHFQGGVIYWGRNTVALYGAILDEYRRLGGPDSFLGLPVSDEETLLGGRVVHFEGGDIFWTAQTGARAGEGPVGAKYLQTVVLKDYYKKSVQEVLGESTGPEQNIPGGRVRYYQGGAIYWSWSTGAQVVHGAIATRYEELGGAESWLGFPTADEAAFSTGRFTSFQNGYIFWSPSTGARAVSLEMGAKLLESSKLMDINGKRVDYILGMPTSDETTVAGGRVVRFKNGDIYWSPQGGAVIVHGAIRTKYHSMGGPSGTLGLPTSDEAVVSAGRVMHFQGGDIFRSVTHGACVVAKAIGEKYLQTANMRDANGKSVQEVLGPAISDEQDFLDGRVARFQGGNIYWSTQTGGHVLYGPALARYSIAANEVVFGRNVQNQLGLPISDEVDMVGGRVVHFQHGEIYLTPDQSMPCLIFGEIASKYRNLGALGGPLGAPQWDGIDRNLFGTLMISLANGVITCASDGTDVHAFLYERDLDGFVMREI